MMLHKLRAAVVAPQREPLKRRSRSTSSSSAAWRKAVGAVEHAVAARRCCVGSWSRSGVRARAGCGLQVLKDASARSLGGLLKSSTEPGAIVHTDAWHGYDRLAAEGWDHRPRNQSTAAPGDEPFLPRAHRAISNLKAWLYGTHRWASPEHLQVYLNEYTFRHNRRGNPHAAFQTLLGLSTAPARHLPADHRPGRVSHQPLWFSRLETSGAMTCRRGRPSPSWPQGIPTQDDGFRRTRLRGPLVRRPTGRRRPVRRTRPRARAFSHARR
jgi:transposase-like protein